MRTVNNTVLCDNTQLLTVGIDPEISRTPVWHIAYNGLLQSASIMLKLKGEFLKS